MTRYEELARSGVEHSKRFHAARENCTVFASRLMGHFADYLGAPDDGLQFVELLDGLRFGGCKGSVRGAPVPLTLGPDEFWYFGVQFYFAAPDSAGPFNRQMCRFGVKKLDDAFVLRHGEDVRLHPGDDGAAREFYEALLAGMKAFYDAPIGQPVRKIGFDPSTVVVW